MFGKNEIVGRGFFDGAQKLLVTSYFVTLQGEGPFAGQPAVFVRLAKCNLACSFCDTYFDKGDWYTFEELKIALDLAFAAFDKAPGITKKDFVLVITGGEPSLQKRLSQFLHAVGWEYKATQIESNGILVLDDMPISTHLVVSPKCAEKNGEPVKYLKPNPDMLARAGYLKFVMSAEEGPYNSIPDWAHEWRKKTGRPIYISPMNIYNTEPQKSKEMRAEGKEINIQERSTVDEVISFWEVGLLNMEANKLNHEYAANYAIRHGCIFNVQIHLLASVA